MVDRLLASPAFGERWARHWLDLTGYADQIGTANDIFAEHAWRYRDYVIAAFNADKPFDRFIREQLAGDLLPYGTVEERARNLIATGFLVLGDVPVVEADKAKLRVDVVDQQVDKVGKAFLGLTLGCARCHDHKFDPIPHRDYYAMAGIFVSTESVRKAEWGVWSWPTIAELPETPAEQTERKARLEQHRKAHRGAQGRARAGTATHRRRSPRFSRARKGRRQRSTPQRGRPSRRSGGSWRPASASSTADIEHAEFFTPAVPVAFAVHDSPRPGDMRITIRGNAHALGDEVPRGFVRVVSQNRPVEIPSGESGRRQLADWIASGDNPLTARVAVNRIWQKLFGEGIVRSVDYFGRRGETPTHPELLDALALRFVADGWSQKRLIRSLVLSRTYAMSSAHDDRSRRGRSGQSSAVADESPPARRGVAARRHAGRRGNAHRAAAAGPGCPWSIRRTPEACGRGTSILPASAWPGSGRNRSSSARFTCRSSALAPGGPRRGAQRLRLHAAGRDRRPARRDHRADPGLVPDECQVPEAARPRAGPAHDGCLAAMTHGSTPSGSAC